MERMALEAQEAPYFTIPNREIVAIEHPMIIQNIDNGLKTFGTGMPLAQILSPGSYARSIPVYLRPKDPTCAPVISHNTATTDVVVKITVPKRTGRKRKRGSNDPYIFDNSHSANSNDHQVDDDPLPTLQSHSRLDEPSHLRRILQDNVGKYQIEAVGTVNQTHRYRGLADFHYSTSNSTFMDKMKNTILTGDLERLKQFKIDPDKGNKPDEDIPPPPAFTDQPFPFNWGYHQNSLIKMETDMDGQKVLVNHSEPVKVRTLYVSHSIEKVPTETPFPDPVNEPKLLEMVIAVRKALEERPIWTRRALLNRLNRPDATYPLKRSIQYVGYQFRGGPWRDSVIKYGVDPRKDPKYRVYQTLFFKIFDESEREPGSRWIAHRSEYARAHGTNPQSHIFDGKSIFLDGKIWQICDITDPLLLRIIEGGVVSAKCDVFESGWYANGTYAKLKAAMRTKISAIIFGREMADEEFKDVLSFPDVLPKKKSIFVPVPNFKEARRRRAPRERVNSPTPVTGEGREASPSLSQPAEGGGRVKEDPESIEESVPENEPLAAPAIFSDMQPGSSGMPVDPRLQEVMSALDQQGGIEGLDKRRGFGGVEGEVDDEMDADDESMAEAGEQEDDEDDSEGHDDFEDARDEDMGFD